MIRFFRQIRYKLMSENKTSKYFKYAIGEILLVVIGILIALQINNWNNKRLQGIKEVNYLNEIKANLSEDIERIDSTLAFNKRKEGTIMSTFQLFASETDPLKYVSQLEPFMMVLTSYDYFLPKPVAFDNMVSSENIDLISNDDLRKELSSYYSKDYSDGTQERVKEMTRTFSDHITPLLFNKELFRATLNLDSNLQELNEVNIHQDQKVYSNLFTMLMNLDAQNRLLENTRVQAEQLIKLLNEALDQ